jgi:hypothetical protein
VAEEQRHLEVVVELKPGVAPAPVTQWLERRGLATVPLVVGVLATGDAEEFRAAFGAEPAGSLSIPEELADEVAAIRVVPPKGTHHRI